MPIDGSWLLARLVLGRFICDRFICESFFVTSHEFVLCHKIMAVVVSCVMTPRWNSLVVKQYRSDAGEFSP